MTRMYFSSYSDLYPLRMIVFSSLAELLLFSRSRRVVVRHVDTSEYIDTHIRHNISNAYIARAPPNDSVISQSLLFFFSANYYISLSLALLFFFLSFWRLLLLRSAIWSGAFVERPAAMGVELRLDRYLGLSRPNLISRRHRRTA